MYCTVNRPRSSSVLRWCSHDAEFVVLQFSKEARQVGVLEALQWSLAVHKTSLVPAAGA